MAERMAGWLLRRLSGNWVTLGLLSLLATAVISSLEEAGWVRAEQTFIRVFLFALLFGWLLARSRFPAWFALPYGLLISALAAVEAAGRILPAGASESGFFGLVEGLNLRLFSFYLRASGWLSSYQAGQNIEDTGLFILLVSFALGLATIWFLWAYLRQRRVLNGLLPLGFLLALNVHLSHQRLLPLMVFLLASILLVAHSAFSRQHADWQRRRVDFPDQLGLEWGGSALALALMIVLIARAAPFAGTREGWQAISDLVERMQQRSAETADRLFSNVEPLPQPIDEIPVPKVDTPRLDEIGQPIPQGYATVMWVRISDPAPMPPDIAVRMPGPPERIHYWRNAIFSAYTGRGWEPAPIASAVRAQPEAVEAAPPGRYLLRQDFEILASHTGRIFAVSDPLLTSDGAYIRDLPGSDSALVVGTVQEYQVISAATDLSANQLAAAAPDYPEQIRADYLQLPEDLPPRVRALAERVAGGAPNPYLKALRVQNYLRETYPYSLEVDPAPPGQDVVDNFLFTQKAGFCSHYASAMAVMLRAVDVPARVVTGYAMGSYDSERQAYRVSESASHAWVEVYFPGYGWVEFEPTADRSPFIYREEAGQPPLDSGGPVTIETAPPSEASPFFTGLIAAAALLLLVLPFALLRLFATPRSASAAQVDALYRRMRAALSWAGLAAQPSATPDEYLAQYGGQLAPYRQLDQALRQVTALYRESAYSPRPPEPQRVRAAFRLWRQALWEWSRLWLRARYEALRK